MNTKPVINEVETNFEISPSLHSHDYGIFGPDSVSWKIWSSPAAIIGVIRSFVIEVINSPEASAALFDSGAYKRDPIGRLNRTMSYFLTIVFGDMETVTLANERLNRIHRNIKGITPLTGANYSGQDPLLMLGTHLITWHSVFYAYEKLIGKLSPDEEHQYFRESQRAAKALNIDFQAVKKCAQIRGTDISALEDMTELPASRAEFKRILNILTKSAAVTEQTRLILNALLYPKVNTDSHELKLLLKFYPLLSGVSVCLTPRTHCNIAGFRRTPFGDAINIVIGKTFSKSDQVPGMMKILENHIGSTGYEIMHASISKAAK